MIKIQIDKQIEILSPGENPHSIFEKLGVQFSCSQGICGMCKIDVAKGMENINEKTESELDFPLDDGERLACQCREIKGDIKLKHGSW